MPACSEVFTLLAELLRSAADPAAAEEENDGRAFVRGLPVCGLLDEQLEFTFSRLLVNDGLCPMHGGGEKAEECDGFQET